MEDSLFAMRTAKKAGFLVAGVYDKESKSDQEEIKKLADYYVTVFSAKEISRIIGARIDFIDELGE